MLALSEKQALIQALGQVVFDEVKAAVTPLQDRVTQLEKALSDLAAKDVALGESRRAENQPVVDHGHNGIDGKGLCLDDIRVHLADLVREAVGVLPVPVHPVSWLIDRAGHLHVTHSDGTVHDVGQVVGRDGKDCDMEVVRQKIVELFATIEKPQDGRDGIDGLGIEQIEYDGERTFRLANAKVDRSFTIPFPLYQGIWKQGAYLRGDQVTSDNQQWIAMRDTDKEPGTIDSGWRLACKRGRDGKPGKDGKDAA
jgi:hypothetical protein